MKYGSWAECKTLTHVALQGIFATHLHHLLEADLDTRRMEYWCMETRRDSGGHLEPTKRMIRGTCTDSLALEVAAQSGLPSDVLARAAQFYQVLAPLKSVVGKECTFLLCNLQRGGGGGWR